MNLTVEDICKRLESGESDTAIAQELVDTLNAAVELKSKREKEKEAKSKREEAQKIAEEHIAQSVNDYLAEYYDMPAPALKASDLRALIELAKNTKIETVNKPNKKSIKISTSGAGSLNTMSDEFFNNFFKF